MKQFITWTQNNFYKLLNWFKLSSVQKETSNKFVQTDYKQRFSDSNDFFNWIFPLFLKLNPNLDDNSKYFTKLKKQIKKCFRNHYDFISDLYQSKQKLHTLKKPHTSSLKKWRKDLRTFLRNYFELNPQLDQQKLIILREFHKCRIECHYVEVFNVFSRLIHKRNNFCQCKDENNVELDHKCRHDIHKMILTPLEFDFSSWKHECCVDIVDPKLKCESLKVDEYSSLIHPETEEVVDEMSKTLCYMNKDAEGRFKNPQLYKGHDDNPKSLYFDTFDYHKDKLVRNKMKVYSDKYYQLNKQKIENKLSRNEEYRSYLNKINYLNKKISNAKWKYRKGFIEERNKLAFELKELKKNVKQNGN